MKHNLTTINNLFTKVKLKDSHVTSLPNDLLASAKQFLLNARKDLLYRKKVLSQFVNSAKVQKAAELGQTSAGRKPSIHIETGLLKRFQSAGYANLVQQFPQPTASQFDEQLNKAEQLMANDVPFTGSDRELVAASVRTYLACKFPKQKFTPVTVEHAAETQINKSSSASFPYYKRKGEVIEELINEANKVFKGFKDPFKYPITRGFRLQLRPTTGSELTLKIRVMYPYPGVIILVEDCFIMPFVEHFINTDTFYVIGRNGREIRRLLRKAFVRKGIKKITSSDITAFDQNAINDNILMGFWIIRQQLKLTSAEHQVFMQMACYFCTSYAISKTTGKRARMFLKVKGVPSGSGFTNMIDSLINAIAFEYACPNILNSGSVLICGDDNIFDSTHVDFQHYCNIFEKVFNWKIDPNKTQHFTSYKKLHFLGFDWIDGVRHQLPKLLVNQVLWHSSFLTNLDLYERELARAASVLLNAKNGSYMFKRIFPEIVHAARLGKDIRFVYLYNSAPPSALPGVVSYYKEKSNLRIVGHEQSLLTHLDSGWDIR